jgi:DNA-directed RNA polymerase subunit RPC12/RpoP
LTSEEIVDVDAGGPMVEALAGVCLMCGRTLGYAIQGTFVTSPGGVRPQRQGQHLRCGYCGGGVLFEPEGDLPRDWVAEMRREEAASAQSRRAYRRRAM